MLSEVVKTILNGDLNAKQLNDETANEMVNILLIFI